MFAYSHPKVWGRQCFQFVCQFTPGGRVTPSQSLNTSTVTRPSWVLPIQDRVGYTAHPEQGGGTPGDSLCLDKLQAQAYARCGVSRRGTVLLLRASVRYFFVSDQGVKHRSYSVRDTDQGARISSDLIDH